MSRNIKNIENEDVIAETEMFDKIDKVRAILQQALMCEQGSKLDKELQAQSQEKWRLESEVRDKLNEIGALGRYCDNLYLEWTFSFRKHEEAFNEIEKLKEENEILRKQAVTRDGLVSAIEEISRPDQLRTCRKEIDDLKLDAECEKERLEAIIVEKDETIQEFERNEKDWGEEMRQDRDGWMDRAEKLKEEVDSWRQTAYHLKQEDALGDGRNNILVERMDFKLQELNKPESNEAAARKSFREGIQKGFEEAVNKKVEEIMADDKQLKKERERIKRRLSMSDGTKAVVKGQQEINRRLAERLDEEANIVKQRNERIQQLEDMMRDRDIQIIEFKSETAEKEREAKVLNGRQSSSDRSFRSL